jgi:hypothetical protein
MEETFQQMSQQSIGERLKLTYDYLKLTRPTRQSPLSIPISHWDSQLMLSSGPAVPFIPETDGIELPCPPSYAEFLESTAFVVIKLQEVIIFPPNFFN